MQSINLKEKFDLINDHWNPKIIGELNGQHVKIAKIQGEFVFHHHEHEDELFMLIKGNMKMALRDRVVDIKEGELFIVPKGVEHKPIAEEEAYIMMFEPASTLNTGNVANDRTRDNLEHI